MHQSSFRKRRRLGSVLVALQFCLLLVMVFLAAPHALRGPIPMESLTLAFVSVGLAAWTLWHNQPGNFNIRPTPMVWGVLVTTGPYRWIRHPMYSSVLLGAAALALLSNPLAGWASWTALALVLLLKLRLEETWLQQRHPAYAAWVTRPAGCTRSTAC